MSKEYVIYCNESTDRGSYYSNFYGGALVRSADLELVTKTLATAKAAKNFFGEVKWDKVTANYLDKYKALIDVFFDLVSVDKVKVRIMFTQNAFRPVKLSKEQVENGYFILYYQFLKHAFGLRYSNEGQPKIRLRLLLDQLPATKENVAKFKAYVRALELSNQFREAKIFLTDQDISDVKSHDHDVLQCLDIVPGSMQFRLNEQHKVIPKGKKRRGKRTRAKEALYDHINKRVRAIYPNFNIGISTGTQGDRTNRWRHPYRHWVFMAKETEFVAGKTKNKK
jgi:hypothetical protein